MKNYLLFLSVLFGVLGCATFGSNSQKYQQDIDSAQANIKNQHYQLALESATLAVAADNSNYLGYYLQALAYQNLQQKEPANQSYQKALSLDDEDVDLQLDYANFLCMNKNYQQAANMYDTAFKTAGQNASQRMQVYIGNGDCLTQQNRLDEAVDSYTKALQNESAPLSAYLGVSNAYVLQRNYATAYYYMTLYHGGDNIPALQMKIITLEGLLNSNNVKLDRDKLHSVLLRYYSQLQLLQPKQSTNGDVLTPLNDAQVIAPPMEQDNSTINSTSRKNNTGNRGISQYKLLESRIKTTTAGRHYIIVEKGDTLYNLSVQSKLTQEKLMKINNINQNGIQIGRKIYLD